MQQQIALAATAINFSCNSKLYKAASAANNCNFSRTLFEIATIAQYFIRLTVFGKHRMWQKRLTLSCYCIFNIKKKIVKKGRYTWEGLLHISEDITTAAVIKWYTRIPKLNERISVSTSPLHAAFIKRYTRIPKLNERISVSTSLLLLFSNGILMFLN